MSNPTLIVIDAQQGFDQDYWGVRNNPGAEVNIASLLAYWRERGWTLIHVQHASTNADSPLHPDNPGFAFKPGAQPAPGETVIAKSVNSAFLGTGLEALLRQQQTLQLVVAGFTTDHCVSTTTRMAANLGFEVRLVADACATFERKALDGSLLSAETLHQVNLASLDGEFCRVLDLAALLREL